MQSQCIPFPNDLRGFSRRLSAPAKHPGSSFGIAAGQRFRLSSEKGDLLPDGKRKEQLHFRVYNITLKKASVACFCGMLVVNGQGDAFFRSQLLL